MSWTTEKPTRAGWYWRKVYNHSKGQWDIWILEVLLDEPQLADGGYWQGPLLPNENPTGPVVVEGVLEARNGNRGGNDFIAIFEPAVGSDAFPELHIHRGLFTVNAGDRVHVRVTRAVEGERGEP